MIIFLAILISTHKSLLRMMDFLAIMISLQESYLSMLNFSGNFSPKGVC